MSAAHTPGPWTMETVRTSSGVCFKVGPFPWKEGKLNHACIYADYPNSTGHAICTANARLIASAPELLEALQLCYDHCRLYHPEVEENNVGETVRAAIAKATGGST